MSAWFQIKLYSMFPIYYSKHDIKCIYIYNKKQTVSYYIGNIQVLDWLGWQVVSLKILQSLTITCKSSIIMSILSKYIKLYLMSKEVQNVHP